MSEAQTVADLARKALGEARIIKTEDEREILIVPDSCEHHDITPANKAPFHLPDHIRQAVAVQTGDSLIEYVNRFKNEDSVLFADIEADTIVAALDYHTAETSEQAQNAHRATLKLSRSIEWREWTTIDKRLMEQLDFARFVEENAADIRAPEAAELLECIRDLQAHRKVNFSKVVRTSSDNETFEYSEETSAKTRQGGIEIPTKFKLGIPVYFGEDDKELFAFLRWKLDDGSLKLGIQLHRPEHVRQAVFQEIVTRISERTGCMAVFGKI